MKVATCRIPEVTSPCQALGAASLTCVAARQFVCHKHVCKGPFLASPKIKIFGRTTRTTGFGEQPPPSALPVAQISPLEDSSIRWEEEHRTRRPRQWLSVAAFEISATSAAGGRWSWGAGYKDE